MIIIVNSNVQTPKTLADTWIPQCDSNRNMFFFFDLNDNLSYKFGSKDIEKLQILKEITPM